ncbi:MAG: 50S ribosomal protein L6 [Clostridia bacterium]|nr:50S ribosomal protein L6 [Clostridia bacterium]
MSRIGRKHIDLPAGVELSQNDGVVTVKGPKGTLTQEVDKVITINVDGNKVELTRANEQNETKAKHGLYRALLANMVTGVTTGFERKLIINGVGYKALKQGNKLVLNLGYSHNIEIMEEDGITIECPTALEIVIKGIDKQRVGQFASKIRDLRKVEPYHAYGVRYSDEVVIKKVGKTAGKGKK